MEAQWEMGLRCLALRAGPLNDASSWFGLARDVHPTASRTPGRARSFVASH